MARILPKITNKYGSIVYKMNYERGSHVEWASITWSMNDLLKKEEEMTMYVGQLYYKRKDKYYFQHSGRTPLSHDLGMVYDAKTNTISVLNKKHNWVKTELISVVLS